ncbi:MAG: hypothetical protein HC767_09515 [Akkermansiaceae bacterium]|nr:hypothetical protein [Akkermansiaceae bacterium]
MPNHARNRANPQQPVSAATDAHIDRTKHRMMFARCVVQDRNDRHTKSNPATHCRHPTGGKYAQGQKTCPQKN